MEGVGSDNTNVLVLGATNLPWEIDPAVRRRFERRIYIGLPDESSRKEIVRHHLGDTPNSLIEDDLDEIASLTDRYSGSDLSTLVKDAIYAPIAKCEKATKFIKTKNGNYVPTYSSDPNGIEMSLNDMDPSLLEAPLITMDDFQNALTKTKSSVALSDLDKYEEWTEEFGQEA